MVRVDIGLASIFKNLPAINPRIEMAYNGKISLSSWFEISTGILTSVF
jgi:hypothetical protein